MGHSIKTAEEFIKEWNKINYSHQVPLQLQESFKQYANQFIDLAMQDSYHYDGIQVTDHEDLYEINNLIK